MFFLLFFSTLSKETAQIYKTTCSSGFLELVVSAKEETVLGSSLTVLHAFGTDAS